MPQQPWFSTLDPKTNRHIDVAKSFAPQGIAIAAKALIFAAVVGTWVYYFIDNEHPAYAMAFLTHWGYASVVLYITSSLLNSLWGTAGMEDASSFRVRTSWVLFELSVHLTTLASFGYYAFLFDPATDWEYLNIATHGGALPLVLIDGLVINRIPWRLSHYFGLIFPIEILYVVWTYIHSRTDIGNPGDNDSDALYAGSLEWTEETWLKSLIIIAILLLGVGPIAFAGWWALTNGVCCCRDIQRHREDTEIAVSVIDTPEQRKEPSQDSTNTDLGESQDATEELA